MLKKEYRGFTLIELMVVMAIIAVLATLIVGAVQLARNTATETAHRSNGRSIEAALEANFAKYRQYCGTGDNPLACTTGTPITFQAAATALNVGLSATPECDDHAASVGGGTVEVISGAYVIDPYDAACSVTQGTENEITIGTME